MTFCHNDPALALLIIRGIVEERKGSWDRKSLPFPVKRSLSALRSL